MIFSKLRVWDTEQNNGVLIYVESPITASRSSPIAASRGTSRASSGRRSAMRERFRAGDFEGGALIGIERVGEKLAQFFPLIEATVSPDEPSNRPAVLQEPASCTWGRPPVLRPAFVSGKFTVERPGPVPGPVSH